MSDTAERRVPLPVILIIKYVLNAAMVWFMASYLGDYFQLTGGLGAYIVVGALLTLMNIIVRPLLHIITLPLKLFATLVAVILTQAVFVQLTVMIVHTMDPAVVTLEIFGGLWGWIVVAVILGLGNWLMKVALK
jgi:uncharacterized membrane protein YvlD (DUF360 family)